MKNIKNIIFDYGNVIFSLDFEKSKEAWNTLGINNAEEFYGHKVQDDIFDKFEKGEITPIEFRQYIKKKISSRVISDQQIDEAWNSLLVGIPSGNHELLLTIRQKYRTFLLSNNVLCD